MIDALGLPVSSFLMLCGICFVAGLVRGFSGFALSAFVMAISVVILPPVQLIPMLWVLELSASLLMVRSGFKEADKSLVLGLWVGTLVGLPIGLTLTKTLPVETSKIVALAVIVTLAALQLSRLKPAFLATRPGLVGTGITTGIVTGLANVGGMVVALYVLSRKLPARITRASLVLFLFVGSANSLVFLLLLDVMTPLAFLRGLALIVPTALGVLVGKALFRPEFERYYRPLCLSLLIGLAGVGLLRQLLL